MPLPVPSTDQLSLICRIWWGWMGSSRYQYNHAYAEEDERLKYFGPLSDALRPVRPLIGRFEGWPVTVGLAVATIADGFDAIAREWGWSALDTPEPGRSEEIARRRAVFFDSVERPLLEAAISWRDGWTRFSEARADVEEWAQRGADLGLTATMTPDEGKRRWHEGIQAWYTSPRIGTRYPSVDAIGEDHESGLRLELIQAFNVLKAALEKRNGSPLRPWYGIADQAGPDLGPSAPADQAPSTDDLDDLAASLRRRRSAVQAAFLEFMSERSEALFADIAAAVHGDRDASDGAIRQNVYRVNESLQEAKLPLRFKVASGRVFKEENAE